MKECEKCGKNCNCIITINLSRKELERILDCMDITKDEFGPFPPRSLYYKVYKKLKNAN